MVCVVICPFSPFARLFRIFNQRRDTLFDEFDKVTLRRHPITYVMYTMHAFIIDPTKLIHTDKQLQPLTLQPLFRLQEG